MKDLLRWIMNITLVVGLAMFTGHRAEFGPTLTKTELVETRSGSNYKETACFKKSCIKHSDSFQQAFNLPSSFTSYLWQYDNLVRVKFKDKDNFKMLTLLKDRQELFQSNHNPNNGYEESDTDKSKG